jgi:hypothetical protein
VWRPDEAQRNLLYLHQLRSNQRLFLNAWVQPTHTRSDPEDLVRWRRWKRASV